MTDPDDVPSFLRTLAAARNRSAAELWDQAARLWEQVVASNPAESSFWANLANACYRSGKYREAIPKFERAIELGDGDGTAFSTFPFDAAYRIACCYALLQERDRALKWLGRAFEMGYRDLERAQEDSDLASLRDDPRFREIVGMTDVSILSRDEGWRIDLELLARRIKLKAYDLCRHISEQELDRRVEEISTAIPQLTDAQIILEMMKLLALLGDGHAFINPPDERIDLRQALPIQFYVFEEGLHIVAADPKHEILLGAQVLRFGDQPVDVVLAGLLPIVCRDNEQEAKLTGPFRLRRLLLVHALGLIPDPNEVTLTLLDRNGHTKSMRLSAEEDPKNWPNFLCPEGWITLPEILDSPLPTYVKNMNIAYWFEYLPDSNTLYFQFNAVRNEPVESLSAFNDRLFDFIDDHDVQRLIIDVRWNGGGNTFLEMPLLHRIIGNRKINRRGSLWVIIAPRTFSAAQTFVTFLDCHTEAIFVGEPTGSRPNFVGETIPICLPYTKLQANVSDLYWQTSWPEDHRTWIAPHIYTPPTFATYRQNRDPALEAILACSEHLPGW